MLRIVSSLTLALIASTAQAQTRVDDTPSGQPVPRYVSLKFDASHGRTGPSMAHPIAWVYRRAGIPMQVIAETENWRRVRDPEGEVTWMHRSILSGRRAAMTVEETVLRARAEDDAPIEAVADAGVILELDRCRTGWCRAEAGGYRGWVSTEGLWGVYPEERSSEGQADADGSPALSASLPRDTALR